MSTQQIHLWPVRAGRGSVPRGVASAAAGALPLPFAPAVLPLDPDAPLSAGRESPNAMDTVTVEPFFNQHKQLRLFARFSDQVSPTVNGEPAPRMVVLSPGDHFQWGPGLGFHVALYHKPQIGPPPAAVLGKLCPVCRVPFTATSTCVTCLCGVVLHCEPDDKEGLQCGQLRRECPVCQRPIVLTEGYVTPPPSDED